ncbi:CoA-binding protein [Natrialba asiatica]|uniref:CoA-binding protein n=1 Tax=Natrialba asiatica (strain ATCC 700177 / DSM 12278 / JCM 9576 / FERM P-10747 / NBRC 102637 / 172P1) TaxID=29540 RepID=M0B574_NATA1|nr:CoA-binding protein [Natrialba asiatica]ELZ05955.1 CoA-binding protein [Natrialba asiatica DSM 12278]
MPTEETDELRRILEYDRVAVVGASTSYEKAAHIVPAYLQRHGYDITPINPNADEVFGERAYDSLADVTEPIDIVEIFRPSEEVPELVEQALARSDVKAIWMQLGIRHDEAAQTAEAAGLAVVQDHCMKVEHGRLIRHPMD